MSFDMLCGKGGETDMPIYEFQCNTCAHIFDELVPMNTQGDLMKCPKCDSVGARKARGSFLSATHGLENGHIAVGRKLTGKGSAPSSSDSGNTPAASGSTPAAAGNTPAAAGSTPVASGSAPAASGSTPAASGSTSKAAGV
jgi:putative FmdB family regulatory protein